MYKKLGCLTLIAILMTSCGQKTNVKEIVIEDNNKAAEAENTGNPVAEKEVNNEIFGKEEIIRGKVYYITASSLYVRSEKKVGKNILGQLSVNNKVKVLNIDLNDKTDYVEIEIVNTESNIKKSSKYYVSYKYLDEKAVPQTQVAKISKKFKYFVIQNIATERLRVYERNTSGGDHKLILETVMVAGRESDGPPENVYRYRTIVGNFTITKWIKFYQDNAGSYPSWYKSSYPDPPEKGSRFTDWFSEKYMPKNKEGERVGDMRGAFGWYTAKVGPDSHYQWTHGTIGYGTESESFIAQARNKFFNMFKAMRSHGCSRVSNPIIAWLYEFLPEGSPIIKIYAKEDLANVPTITEEEAVKYYPKWRYILTTGKNDTTSFKGFSHLKQLKARGINKLDLGTLTMDNYPNAVPYVEKNSILPGLLKPEGNVYGVDDEQMVGIYYVDTGKLQGYQHPKELVLGGLKKVLFPPYIIKD